jgi:hypothetical protein
VIGFDLRQLARFSVALKRFKNECIQAQSVHSLEKRAMFCGEVSADEMKSELCRPQQ